MLYKRQIERIDGAERVMQLIDHCEAVLKRSSPHLFHKLIFKCDQSELVTTRRLLSLPFGFALGLLLHWALVSNFLFRAVQSEVAMWSMVATITLGYVASVQARCVLLLLLPTMFTRIFRSAFYGLIFRELLVNVFAAKLYEVLKKLVETLFCFFSFRLSLKMWLWRERVSPLGRRFLDQLTDPMRPFRVGDLAADHEKISQMLEIAHNSMDSFVVQCTAQLDGFVYKCADVLVTLPVGPLQLPYVGRLLGEIICKKIMEVAQAGDVCNTMKENFQRALENAKEGINEAIGKNQCSGPMATMMAKLPDAGEWERQAAWNDFGAFEEEMLGNLTALFDLFKGAGMLLELATMALFFWGLLAANAYHREYLRSLPYENFYIDRYFRRIDARRQAKNKEHLLPLRGTDRDDLVALFSPLMTKREREQSSASVFLSVSALLLLLLIGLLLYGAASLLSDYLNYLAAELDFIYSVHLYNRFEPRFENHVGKNNSITETLNRLVGRLRWSEDFAHWEFDLSRCRRTVKPLHLLDHTGAALRVLLLIAVLLASTYLARARKLIADYFYRRYAKERTLYLYNDRLRRRKAYLCQRKAHLKEALKVMKVFEQRFDPCFTSGKVRFAQQDHLVKRIVLALYYWWQGKQCFVCLRQITVPYIACDTVDCRLLYCALCFEDIGGRCLHCRAGQQPDRFALVG